MTPNTELNNFLIAALGRRSYADASLRRYAAILLTLTVMWTGVALAEPARFAFGVNGLDFSLSRYMVREDGRLRHLGHIPLVKSVPFVLLDPSGRFVLVPSKTVSHISVFKLNMENGALTEVPGSPFKAEAVSPFTLAFHPSGRYLYAAARFSGVGAYSFDPESGALAPLKGSPYKAGERTRGVTVHPSGKFLYATNGYSNNVSAYGIDSATGQLKPLNDSPFAVGDVGNIDYVAYGMQDVPESAGGIPYDITIGPQGKYAFVANWATASVTVFRINTKNGHLNAVKGSPFFTGFNPYRLKVHPKGGYLYVTQFSAGEIAVHTIDIDTGELNVVKGSPFSTGGVGPVAVNFSADGKELYVPNYESNDISLFTVDALTGGLALQEVLKTRSGPWYLALTAGLSDSVVGTVEEQNKPLDVFLAQGDKGLSRLEIPHAQASGGQMSAVSGAAQPVDQLQVASLPGGEFIYTLDRASARINSYRIDAKTKQLLPIEGESVSTGPKPGQMVLDVNSWYLYVTNTGDNTMSTFYLNPQTGALKQAQKGPPIPAGKNPVSVALDASARYAYVVNSDANNVSVYSYMNSVTPLIFESRGAGSPFAVGEQPTSVTVEPAGHYAYVTNAASNTVSAFQIHFQTGALSALPGSPFKAGNRPVSSVAHPNGKWLFVVNEVSKNIITYGIEVELGALNRKLKDVKLPVKASSIRLNVSGDKMLVLSSDGLRLLSYSVDEKTGSLEFIAEKIFVEPVLDILIRD
ncbi:MAG: beta-propeller fold lactonase family protein [Ectothiorhodospiraceae bacterium]|nr:beta-propeller fold lactonase family protein [Ectothiorhodospiraceae bacterium]